MSKLNNIRGLLLEEALLFLLRNSGYETVEDAGKDPTLIKSSNGLNVKGRGEKHQIDAIADFKSSPPFSNPQRFLIEAKCFVKNKKVGIQTIRNAVGVLIDVQEYFVASDKKNIPNRIRYHYTYGIFSSNEYSFPAERYAYAHDIYLIPVARSRYFKPILDSIYDFKKEDLDERENKINLNLFRKAIRKTLQDSNSLLNEYPIRINREKIIKFISECKRIDIAFIAIAGKSFPILLIPSEDFHQSDIKNIRNYKIRILNGEWYIESENGKKIFSFDLPEKLMNLYFEGGIFNQESALNLKEIEMNELKIIVEEGNNISNFSLKLDKEWIGLLRDSGYGREK